MYLTPEEKKYHIRQEKKAKEEQELKKCLVRYKKSRGTIIRLSEIIEEVLEEDIELFKIALGIKNNH